MVVFDLDTVTTNGEWLFFFIAPIVHVEYFFATFISVIVSTEKARL